MNPINLLWNKMDHLRYWFVLQQFDPVETLMDIGCGNNPQKFIEVAKRHYTVDPAVQDSGINYFHINGTWKHQGMNILRNNTIHTVVAMDVIEHIEKREAICLLEKTKEYVQQIVVSTPLGFMEQEDETNQWNSHKSGWVPLDFSGWEVYTFPHFHWCDFKGRVLDPPRGTMLAVWRR